MDKPMWPALRTDAEIWENCTKTILGLLEDSFEIENKGRPAKRMEPARPAKPGGILRNQGFQLLAVNSNGSIKRKRSFTDNVRDRKMQRISTNLANDIARHLSVSDHENSKPIDDVDMDTSINKPPVAQRVYRRAIRKSAPRTGQNEVILRRISTGGNGINIKPLSMDFDEWLKTQAQRQNLNILEYRQAFHEKQNQLHHYLAQIDTADHTKTDDQRFQSIKENLGRILMIADELSGDHSLAFADIFPEWKAFEGHINKLASYVQSIDDMKELVSQAIPRTSDLVYDIRRLQTVLESKVALYGDNLVQNGLAWKTMGLPVDEQLIATVKGWFYNLCIGLIGELDTECSKLRSLVTDMRELMHHPEGDKLMESIQNGVEFIASVVSFIGLPSRKLVYGCRILASIYGQWASENLEFLRETHTKGSPKIMDVKMTNAATTSSTRPTTRVDIRLMQWTDGVVQVLTSLQTLQEVGGAAPASLEDDQSTFDSESLGVLENLASTLVEITVRALSVIETTRRNNHTKQGNIMMNPETALIYMERSVLSFADRVIEVSGREGIDGPRIQRLHAHLEQNEEDLQL